MLMKILMTTMSFDIGGAETHIVELCKELVRRDCNIEVTVASNGGIYVDELLANGIKHVSVPLHTKNLFSVIKSYGILKKLIKREKFDVVHAHARIPAFISGLICNALKVRFVTTAHGVYDMNPYWRFLSNWGEQVLAVSYDVKQYLIDQYDYPSDNVTVTINGIDDGKYSKDVDYSDIITEFDLNGNDDSHRVVYVSRTDIESAHIAFQLAEAAPMLYALYPDLEIIIVGHGTAFHDLKAQADNVNRLLGKRVIIMTGSRTDTNKFFACADVFIGVSRSALEAMATEVPVILSGSQGYIGIFNEINLKAALDTNFCGRGFEMSNAKQIYNDIISVFSMSEEERRASGKYNRALVIERYSIKRMADDALAVYKKVTPYQHYKHGEIIMSGYYGFGNLGDDSLLQQIVNSIRTLNPDSKITVLSKTPKKTAKTYGVKAINRFNFLTIINEMKHAGLLINGGGNLLQNKTSNRSLIYYIFIMKLAKRYGLKLMLYASGIGPLYGEKYKRMTKNILNEADIITLRENLSMDEICQLGVETKNISVTCDPAFYIQCADENWVKYIMYREGLSLNKKYFLIAPRNIKDHHKNFPSDFTQRIIEACSQVSKKYKLDIIIVPLQPRDDMSFCKKIAQRTGGKIISGLNAAELAGLSKHMEFVASVRLHMLIYAISASVPVLAIDYDPKVTALFERMNLPYIIDAEHFTPGKFVDMSGALMNNNERVRVTLDEWVKNFRNLSLTDARLVIELLKKDR